MGVSVSGPFKTVSPKTRSVAIGKHVFSFGRTCDFSRLKAGERVVITFSTAGGTWYATAIKPA